MPRLLFTKTGDAVWMSHLDLMRLFQRAFKRAGLALTHTKGFNPRPSVSIALPLSVGVESVCELLDFELEGESVPCEEITQRLNAVLVKGIQVYKTYDNFGKIRDLALLDCCVALEYDAGIPAGAEDKIAALFAQDSLLVEKRGKNGPQQQDIIPMIRSLEVIRMDDHILHLHARICCQNPSLNPAQLVAAIEHDMPEYAPDFSRCKRLEIYDHQERIFR